MTIVKLRKGKTLVTENFRDFGILSFMALQKVDEKLTISISRHRWIYGGLAVILAISVVDSALAVTVDSLKSPITSLKEEIFGGWMTVGKIGACAAGIVFSIAKQSLGPLGIGCGIGIGGHFYDKWIGDGSAALI